MWWGNQQPGKAHLYIHLLLDRFSTVGPCLQDKRFLWRCSNKRHLFSSLDLTVQFPIWEMETLFSADVWGLTMGSPGPHPCPGLNWCRSLYQRLLSPAGKLGTKLSTVEVNCTENVILGPSTFFLVFLALGCINA